MQCYKVRNPRFGSAMYRTYGEFVTKRLLHHPKETNVDELEDRAWLHRSVVGYNAEARLAAIWTRSPDDDVWCVYRLAPVFEAWVGTKADPLGLPICRDAARAIGDDIIGVDKASFGTLECSERAIRLLAEHSLELANEYQSLAWAFDVSEYEMVCFAKKICAVDTILSSEFILSFEELKKWYPDIRIQGEYVTIPNCPRVICAPSEHLLYVWPGHETSLANALAHSFKCKPILIKTEIAKEINHG